MKKMLILLVMLLLVQTALADKVIVGFKDKPSLEGKQLKMINAVALDLPDNAIDALRHNPNVAYVEEDYKIQALGYDWGIQRIEADQVHQYPSYGTGVNIAVIDTGIDYNHPALDGVYAGGYDFVNDDNDPLDDAGHGTHVSGTIAAELSTAYIGAAPEADIYALKVLDSSGSGYTSDLILAIEWAVENDMQIASMSLGSDYYSAALEAACNDALANNLLIIAAAGNDGSVTGKGDSVDYPARFDSVVAVAATDSEDKRAKFSSTGPAVEISAPGVSITSTYLGGAYAIASGTSMATPHVSGVAALVYATPVIAAYDYNNNNAWDAAEVRQRLRDSTVDLGLAGRDTLYGFGLIKATLAVEKEAVPSHDLAIIGFSVPSTAAPGEDVTVEVTVQNKGTYDEYSAVQLEENSYFYASQNITLQPGMTQTLSFLWSGELGSYLLSASVYPVAGETSTADNYMEAVIEVVEESQCISHGAFCNCNGVCDKKETTSTCPWDCQI